MKLKIVRNVSYTSIYLLDKTRVPMQKKLCELPRGSSRNEVEQLVVEALKQYIKPDEVLGENLATANQQGRVWYW